MGLRIWLWQRLTALYLLCYAIWLLILLLQCPSYDYISWKELWSHHIVSSLSLVAFIAIGIHAVLGLWFILSDYLKQPLLRWLLLGGYAAWFTAALGHFIVVLGGL